MRLIFYHFFIESKWLIYIISFKVIALGIHTALESMFPLFIAVLELGYWSNFQLVSHRHFNNFLYPKITSLKGNFYSWNEKKVTRAQVGWIWGLRAHGNIFSSQKLVNRNGCVTGYIIMIMQHLGVFNVWTNTNDPFSKSFKNFFIKVLVNCLALRYKLLVVYSLAIKETNRHGFDFWLAHSSFFASVKLQCTILGSGALFPGRGRKLETRH